MKFKVIELLTQLKIDEKADKVLEDKNKRAPEERVFSAKMQIAWDFKTFLATCIDIFLVFLVLMTSKTPWCGPEREKQSSELR